MKCVLTWLPGARVRCVLCPLCAPSLWRWHRRAAGLGRWVCPLLHLVTWDHPTAFSTALCRCLPHTLSSPGVLYGTSDIQQPTWQIPLDKSYTTQTQNIKTEPHSSSKPVFLMVSPVSKNRTRSLVLRFKHWGSSSPFFFYSHFTFIWWQITLTLPSVHVLEPPIGRYPLCPSHIALSWMMAMTLTGFHISPPPSCCPLCKSSLLTASRQPRIHSEYEADLACLQAVGSLLPFSLPLALTRDLCWGVALPTHLCPGTPWSPSLPKCSPCPYHKWTCCMHKLVSLWKAQEGWACFIFFVGFLGIFGPRRDLQCL